MFNFAGLNSLALGVYMPSITAVFMLESSINLGDGTVSLLLNLIGNGLQSQAVCE